MHYTFIFIIDFAYRIHVAKWFHCTVSTIIKVPLVDSLTLSPKVLGSTPRWDDLLIFWKMNCNIYFLNKVDFAYRMDATKWFPCTASTIIKVPLAQWIARWTSNPKVLGSTPRWDDLIIFWKMNCIINLFLSLTLVIAYM